MIKGTIMGKRSKNTEKKKGSMSKKSQSKHSVLELVWNLLFYVLMIFIIFSAGMMAIMQQQDKSFNGYRLFGVLTNSMVSPDNTLKEGGFRAGDVLIIKDATAKDLKVGDIVTFRPSSNPDNKSTNYLTHRVVKIQDGLKGEKGYYITTRGDANKTDDMPMSEKALVGKVVRRVPKIGGIIAYVKDNFILSIVFIASVIGFVWVIKMYIISGDELVAEKKKNITKKSSKVKAKSVSNSKSKSHSEKNKVKSKKNRKEQPKIKKNSESHSKKSKKKKKK